MTLVEISISLVVLMLAIGAVLGATVSVGGLGTANRETMGATLAARQALEELQTETFSEVFARYNTEPADDPDGPGSAVGAHFDVRGLDPQPDDPDGRVGRFVFPTPAGSPGVLREDLADSGYGLPTDLNADGDIDGLDHSDDYFALPVGVEIRWRGGDGKDHTIELRAIVADR